MSKVIKTIDTCELNPMIAIFKITGTMMEMKRGEILEVIGKYRHFQEDMKNICTKLQKKYIFLSGSNNGFITCQIYI